MYVCMCICIYIYIYIYIYIQRKTALPAPGRVRIVRLLAKKRWIVRILTYKGCIPSERIVFSKHFDSGFLVLCMLSPKAPNLPLP